jgi:uncharacterized protein YbdZ (MbtH family)
MATMKRCRAQLSLSGPWGSEHLWDGLEVDVDRELAPGFTVGHAIAGRDDCFDDVTIDAGDAPDGVDRVPVDTSWTTMRPISAGQTAAATPLKDQE